MTRDKIGGRSDKTDDILQPRPIQVLALPKGSHILCSAVTIPDMIRIIERHGLVPIAIDISVDTLRMNLDILQKSIITGQAKMILHAHLFGMFPYACPWPFLSPVWVRVRVRMRARVGLGLGLGGPQCTCIGYASVCFSLTFMSLCLCLCRCRRRFPCRCRCLCLCL